MTNASFLSNSNFKLNLRLIEEVLHKRKKKLCITLFRGKNWTYTNNATRDLVIFEKDFLSDFKGTLDNLMVQPKVFIYFLSRSFYENSRCIIK
jgi:hypothetical protein